MINRYLALVKSHIIRIDITRFGIDLCIQGTHKSTCVQRTQVDAQCAETNEKSIFLFYLMSYD